MQITVSGKQVDVGEALRTHIENRLEEGISKYLDRVTSVDVVVSRESHLFRVDISGYTGTHSGIVIKSRGESEDSYAAFDSAADKIEKQLRRYKRRITNHHKRQAELPSVNTEYPLAARKYVITDQEDHQEDESPIVIAEKQTNLEKLSVSEAVMKMDLADLPALMFINSLNSRINVVYRRHDGNISWVDPAETIAKAA